MFPNEFAYLNQNPVSYSVVCMEFVLYIPNIYYEVSSMYVIDRGAYHISIIPFLVCMLSTGVHTIFLLCAHSSMYENSRRAYQNSILDFLVCTA